MAKKQTVPAKGKMAFTTFICDRGGVGHIRTILPSMILGSWRYKQMTFEPIYMPFFVPEPKLYTNQTFVKFQRSATMEQLRMIQHFRKNIAKQTKTGMIYEIDDLLYGIPESNFASKYYQENWPNIERMLATVDGITVSTPYLRNKYLPYNSNISVVRNRLAKCMWGDIKTCEPKERKKLKIVYPGSQNHFSVKGSGGDIGEKLMNYIHETKKDRFEWIFVGGIPGNLRGDKDITHYEWIEYMAYPMFMKNLEADIGIAPLEINEFNACKSDLKMLEYCVCGIPAIYTKIEPYKYATLTAPTEDVMIDKIERLAADPQHRYNVWKKDTDKIKDRLFLEDNMLKWVNEHMALFKREIK